MANRIKPVLCVVTSHPIKGDTGEATGFWLSELTHALAVLNDAGIPTELASVRGGQPPIDGFDLSDKVNARYWNDPDFRAALANSFPLADIDTSRYSAVFFAGGHGTMWDFPTSAHLAAIVSAIHATGGVVGAVCHGPAGLVNARRTDGRPLVEDVRIKGFTDAEEREMGLAGVVPFLLETQLRNLGARFEAAPNFTPKAVADDRVITGQNPMSSDAVAGLMLEEIAAREPVRA